MAVKGCSAFPKAPALLEHHHQIVLRPIQETHWGKGSYPFTVVQSVYFTVPTDWENYILEKIKDRKYKITILQHFF